MSEKIPKPTINDPENKFPETSIPRYIIIAIISFVIIIAGGIIALISAVLGSLGGG